MADLQTEAIKLLTYLLPGFTAAWLFYGLTSHLKPSQFERVIQALIFTFVIQVILHPVKWLLLIVGGHIPLGPWGKSAVLFSSLLIALLLGGLVAYFTNKDYFHKLLRRWGF